MCQTLTSYKETMVKLDFHEPSERNFKLCLPLEQVFRKSAYQFPRFTLVLSVGYFADFNCYVPYNY